MKLDACETISQLKIPKIAPFRYVIALQNTIHIKIEFNVQSLIYV